ncbi:MAG: hydroxymethylglutaryl-CoA reductase, degradative [Woeseiaceae bacterium]
MSTSRIPGFYKLPLAERIGEMQRRGWLSAVDARALLDGRTVLTARNADRMIENVVGVFGLPFAIAPNFVVNGRDYLVPMVVEEPSIVAALSSAASLAGDGFRASCDESLLVGQIHVTGAAEQASVALRAASDELLQLANAAQPRLEARGGGARDLELHEFDLPDQARCIAVHLAVDTRDAMGANLVNTMCEAIAPRIAELSGGRIAMRILSNLCDRSLVTASVRFPVDGLGNADFTAAAVRDGIVLCSTIAARDSYRAATHNKGVMNGIDPLAIATGNDWRAIEAGAHAFAASSGRYKALSTWRVASNGDLVGDIRLPLKVGIVGGTLSSNPGAALGLALTGAQSATELACLMAAVGLAQNFAALRALATSGIQQGHMRLHARSVASSVGAPDELQDELTEQLVASGEVKPWKARQLLASMLATDETPPPHAVGAAGKVILLGEHAVVYGKHALALPIRDAALAWVDRCENGLLLKVPEWQLAREIDPDSSDTIDAAVALILRELDVPCAGFRINVRPRLPGAMGLGSSATFAVAIIRAFESALELQLTAERINEIAFECEKLAHGTPSGVDNTLAVHAVPMLFRNDAGLHIELLSLAHAPSLLVAWGDEKGSTIEQVSAVRQRRAESPAEFAHIFEQIDALTVQGASLLQQGDFARLGQLMNICHGLLNAIGVSTPGLERMVDIARQHGALGAKLTGAGGGGSIVALCDGNAVEIGGALEASGFKTHILERNVA